MTNVRAIKARLTPAQQKLVESALPVVQRVARGVRHAFRDVPREDLVSFGREGLVEAALRFDPELFQPGNPLAFELYAWGRVRGAMLDGVASLLRSSIAPWKRRVRARAAEAAMAFEKLAHPEDSDEVCLERIREAVQVHATICMLDWIAPPTVDPTVERDVDRGRVLELFTKVRAELAPDDEALFRLRYEDDMSLIDCASALDVPYRTLKRRHADLLYRIRKRLEELGISDA